MSSVVARQNQCKQIAGVRSRAHLSTHLSLVPFPQPDLQELLLCLNELFALLYFTPHLFHLVLVRLPWYHVFTGLQLVLRLRRWSNKHNR